MSKNTDKKRRASKLGTDDKIQNLSDDEEEDKDEDEEEFTN